METTGEREGRRSRVESVRPLLEVISGRRIQTERTRLHAKKPDTSQPGHRGSCENNRKEP